MYVTTLSLRNNIDVPHSCKINKSLFLLLLHPTAKGGAKRGHDAEHATDDVSEGDGKEVSGEELTDTDLSTTHNAQGDHEHICNAVLQAKGDKGRDGEPNSRHLANKTGAAGCHVNSHADQPVAQNAADERLLEAKRCLHGGDIDRAGKGAKSTRSVCQIGEEERTDKVADVASDPGLGQLALGSLALHEGSSHKSSVASEKLATSNERHDQTKREAESTENDLFN